MVGVRSQMKREFIERINQVLSVHSKHSLLSNWEAGFCESLLDQANRGRNFSEKQLSVLSRCEEKCSSEGIEAAENWARDYAEKYRAIAMVCATYYNKSQYFRSLSSQVLHDPDFVPTQNAYKKMCENKYAKKVLASVNSAPKYAIGSTVELRQGQTHNYIYAHLANVPCLVLETLSEVVTAAKGGKQYRILPYGRANTLVVEERHIKNSKRKKKAKKTVFSETSEDIPF